MASSLENILLIGSTGTIGTAIRTALVTQKSKFKRIGVLTTTTSLEKKKDVFDGLQNEGLEIVLSDLDDKESLSKALKGMPSVHVMHDKIGWDAVICALAPPAVPKQKTVIDAAVAAGVSRFIPSEFGFDLSTPFNAVQPSYKGKIAIEKYLQDKSAENPNFPTH